MTQTSDPSLQSAINSAVAMQLKPYIGEGLAYTVATISKDSAVALKEKLHATDCMMPNMGNHLQDWMGLRQTDDAKFTATLRSGLEAAANDPQAKAAIMASALKADDGNPAGRISQSLSMYFGGSGQPNSLQKDAGFNNLVSAIDDSYKQIWANRDLTQEKAVCPAGPVKASPGR